MSDCELDRVCCPTHKWTFSVDAMRKAVETHLEGRVLNLFAGQTKLNHTDEIVRNDINEDIDADYHVDAVEVGDVFDENSFQTVILDPPFSIRNAILKYDGEHVGKWNLVADGVEQVLQPGGVVVSFGHNSTGLSQSRGFKKENIYLFNHKGGHHDTICTVERQMNNTLEEYE